MEYKDYYKIMGLDRNASQEEIKRAYRRLARKYHPDVSKEKDAEARFKELGEAYEVLRDPEKRAAYDQLGARWQAGQEFRPPPDWNAGFEFHSADGSGVDPSAFSDFFESLFGEGFSRGGQGGFRQGNFRARGEDQHARVTIDLEDAYKGARKTLSLRYPEVDAQGRTQLKDRSLNVQIPKGVKQGQKIRLAGQGTAGFGGGEPGDLYLEIEFKPHRHFRVHHRDVYLDLPVTPWEAALGAKINVPTPAGKVDLQLPPGTRSGSRLRLKGKGIPGNPPGDIYVLPQIVLPPANTAKARKLYREMAQELAFNPRADLGGAGR